MTQDLRYSALKKTPFHSRTSLASRTNKYYNWNGYTVPTEYSTTELEYTAARNGTSVMDLTPMGKYEITGDHAHQFVDYLVTRDLSKMKDNTVAYIIWCNEDGKVIDDGTIFKFSSTKFMLCCAVKIYNWLNDSAYGFDVTISDVTDTIAALAIQGPTSCSTLKKFGATDLETLKPFEMREYKIDGFDILISRTGFTGDLGYELWTDPKNAETTWDNIEIAGKELKLRPFGMYAIEMTRIEAGFIQTNTDFMAAEDSLRPTRMRSPYEIGMGWLVHLDKNSYFVGKKALKKEKEENTTERCLVGLDIDGDKPAHGSVIYNSKKEDIGIVTAALWSPIMKKNIALASLKRPYGIKIKENIFAEIYHPEELEYRKIWARCKVVKRQFFNPERRNKVPADLYE